jgi:hypothetical protein
MGQSSCKTAFLRLKRQESQDERVTRWAYLAVFPCLARPPKRGNAPRSPTANHLLLTTGRRAQNALRSRSSGYPLQCLRLQGVRKFSLLLQRRVPFLFEFKIPSGLSVGIAHQHKSWVTLQTLTQLLKYTRVLPDEGLPQSFQGPGQVLGQV